MSAKYSGRKAEVLLSDRILQSKIKPQQYHAQVLQLLKQKHPANFSHTKNPPHVMLSMSCYHSENFFSDLYFVAILKLLKKMVVQQECLG